MKFYHGTTKENWKLIQGEGILFGIRKIYNSDGTISKKYNPQRCTYLAVDKEEASFYGDIVLEVEYEPKGIHDNYEEGCWQVRVYEPIPLEQVKEII